MNPVIPLIQLTLRVEREAEAQRLRAIPRRNAGVDEKTVRACKQACPGKRRRALLLQPQCCECA